MAHGNPINFNETLSDRERPWVSVTTLLHSNPANVVWTLSERWCPTLGPTLRHYSGYVVWTLSERWCSTLGMGIEPIFRQCYVSVVATSFPTWGPMLRRSGNIVWMFLNVGAQWWWPTFGQHSGNVVSMLVPNIVLGCFRSRMTVTFKFEFSTHFQHWHASLHWHNHIYKHLWVILPTMTVQLIGNDEFSRN